MNSKPTRRKQKKHNRNDLISFGTLHFLIWLIMYSLLGWWGIFFGFLLNCIMDTGILLSWIWLEKKQLPQKVAHQQKEELAAR